MPSSRQTTDIETLRQIGRERGYSDAEIDARLAQAGLIPSPGFGQQFLHGMGVIGRMGVAGLGNMVSLPFGLAGAGYQAATGNTPPAILQGNQGTAAANQLGLPQYQGAGERIVGSAGENMVGTALFPGGTATRMLALSGGAGGTASGVSEAFGVGPMGQLVTSLAVGGGFPVAGTVLSASIRAALVGAGARKAAAQQALALVQAGNPNAAVTLGQVAEGGAARTIEGGLRNIPGASGTFARTLEQQADEMGQRVEGIASRMGPAASKEVVGAAVTRGLSEGFIPNFRARANELYQKVFNLVPPTTQVTPTAVTQLMAKQNDLMGMARELSDDITNPRFASILEHMDQAAASSGNGTIPFAVMKELRSRLGAMMTGEELIADINMRDVKRLYGAITDDMGAAIQKTGGQPATQAWDRANLFYEKGMDRIEKILNPLIAKRTPEQVMTALMSGTKDGATALRSVLRSLPAAEQGLVRSYFLRQLGRTPEGTFSPELFLRKLHGLAPTARTALFEADQETGKALTALADFAETRRATGRVMFNPSGTAPNVAFSGILNGLTGLGMAGVGAATGTHLGGSAGGAVGAMAGPLLSALAAKQVAERVFTNPRMISWLVRQTKIPFGALTQELAILAKDSQKWSPNDREVAQDFVSAVQAMDWRNILLATAAADATATR